MFAARFTRRGVSGMLIGKICRNLSPPENFGEKRMGLLIGIQPGQPAARSIRRAARAKTATNSGGIKVFPRPAENPIVSLSSTGGGMVNKNAPIYGITRVDNPVSRTHGWLVTIQRRGTIYRRQFSDGVFGGKAKALAEAKAYRDSVVASNPPFSRREHAEIRKKNNKSGVVGVCRYCASETRDKATRERRWFWVASWVLPDGRAKRIKFSVNKYGEEAAFRMAVKARRAALKQMEGNFDPGATRCRKRMSRKG
jgi:hypothetical protein